MGVIFFHEWEFLVCIFEIILIRTNSYIFIFLFYYKADSVNLKIKWNFKIIYEIKWRVSNDLSLIK